MPCFLWCIFPRQGIRLTSWISGRLVTPYTNTGGGFAAFRSMVPVFTSSFVESVKTWFLLPNGMSCFVESLLVLCFFLFIPFTVCHGISWAMCVLSSSSSLVDVVLEVCWLCVWCGTGAINGCRMFRNCSWFGGKQDRFKGCERYIWGIEWFTDCDGDIGDIWLVMGKVWPCISVGVRNICEWFDDWHCIPSCDKSGWMGPKLGPSPADNVFDVACISQLCLCTALHYFLH